MYFFNLSKFNGPFKRPSSTFYSTMDALGFKNTSFEIFYECITKKQYNMVQLDVLYRYKNSYLMSQTYKGKHNTWSKQSIDPG